MNSCEADRQMACCSLKRLYIAKLFYEKCFEYLLKISDLGLTEIGLLLTQKSFKNQVVQFQLGKTVPKIQILIQTTTMLWSPKSSPSLTSTIVSVGTIRTAAGLAEIKPKLAT